LGAKTAEELRTLRSDLQQTFEEAEVASTALRALDHLSASQLARDIESQLHHVLMRIDEGADAAGDMESRLSVQIDELDDRLHEEFDELRVEESTSVAKLEDAMESLKDYANDEIDTVRAEGLSASSRLDTNIESVKQLLLVLRSDVEGDIKSSLKAAESEIQDLRDQVDGDIKLNLDKTTATIKSMRTTLETDIDAVRADMDASMVRTNEKVESAVKRIESSLVSEVSSLSSHIQIAVQSVNKSIDTEIAGLNSILQQTTTSQTARMDKQAEATMLQLDNLASGLVDAEQRAMDQLQAKMLQQQDIRVADFNKINDEIASAVATVEERTVQVEESVSQMMAGTVEDLNDKIDTVQDQVLHTIDIKLDPLAEDFLEERHRTNQTMKQLQKRLVTIDVSVVTSRLACETAIRDMHRTIEGCADGLVELGEKAVFSADSDRHLSDLWAEESFQIQLSDSASECAALHAKYGILQSRVVELEAAAAEDAAAHAWEAA
jgi:hypothetical protein